ncbi:hypothetical protein WR25_00894 [Diploscapter pachys]|uniref:Neurotransmitter-gated ion-channel ligand-binding domain-containing protein n=1 Tax=Diploscapter pachys TaxID=2018661 RepID=A0A2A2KVN1_9BILA|nr:hypothetical protein WR25_00894 [Diploscapter pachys]
MFNLLNPIISISIYSLVVVNGLTQTERDELARKFKYYHNSVRPTAPENIRSILAELIIISSFIDDRLTIRELQERIELPDEFKPWSPKLIILPPPFSVTTTLSPITGQISSYYKIRDRVDCTAEEWKYPFERFICEVTIVCEPDSVLSISQFRDLRADSQRFLAKSYLGAFPSTSLYFSYTSEWPPSLLTAFLPSILIIAIVFQAQWKRRKIASHHIYPTATLMDLWLCIHFITVTCLLIVDVTLPARRVRYTLLVHVDSTQPLRFIPPPFESVVSHEEGHSNGTWGRLHKFAQKALLRLSDETRTKTELLDIKPGEIPMQRHITTAELGQRKKLALLAIAVSYSIFIFTYLIIVMIID